MIQTVKVMAADIDGTLCGKGENLMPLTRKAIQELHAHGVLFGPASGRPIDSRVLSKAEEWGLGFPFDFGIGMNGGELYDASTGKTEKFFLLSRENIRKILTFLKPFDINAIVYTNGYEEVRCLVMNDFMKESKERNHSHVIVGDINVLSEFPTGKVEVQLKEEDRDAVLKVIEANTSKEYTMVQTFRGFGRCTFEFLDPRVNKGHALVQYANKHNIPLENVLGFGDQENDIGLVRDAGWGVTLLNGADLTKKTGNAVTEHDVSDDGVGHYLYDHILNGSVKFPR